MISPQLKELLLQRMQHAARQQSFGTPLQRRDLVLHEVEAQLLAQGAPHRREDRADG